MDEIKLLKKLVSINSVNPFKTVKFEGKELGVGNEQEIALFLEEQLKELGFKVSRQIAQSESSNSDGSIPERFNVIAEKGSGDSSFLLMAHMDTVSAFNGWKTDPFTATPGKENGKDVLYGLGINDMKAGIAIILSALKDFNPKNKKVKVAFVVDEEFLSFGADTLIKSGFVDDVDLALVPEVGEYEKNSDDKTSKSIGQSLIIGRMGRTEYEFFLKGISCHGAQARINKKSVNAVHEAIKLKNLVLKYCDNCEKTFKTGNISITNSAFISHHNGGEAILSVPDSAYFVLDRSFVMNEDMEEEINVLKKIVEDAFKKGILSENLKVEVREKPRPTKPCKPYYISPEDSFVKEVKKIVMDEIDNCELGIGFSVADENRLAEIGIKTLCLGPEGDNCHASQEYVVVDSVKAMTKIYRKILENYC